MAIALACVAELRKNDNVIVYMTHETLDCPVSNASNSDCFSSRVLCAVNNNADYLISLHLNSVDSSSTKGAEVLCQNANYATSSVNSYVAEGRNIHDQSIGIGESVLSSLTEIGVVSRGTIERSGSSSYPSGVKTDYYSILHQSKLAGIPAVIVEDCFISSSSDFSNFLSSDSKLQALGQADARGILNYVLTQPTYHKNSETTESTESTDSTENVPSTGSVQTQAQNPVYQVTASSLNIRSGAGSSYSKVGVLYKGTNVTVTQVSAELQIVKKKRESILMLSRFFFSVF